jgi:hypothetical protein
MKIKAGSVRKVIKSAGGGVACMNDVAGILKTGMV